jgi:hypothetical protein
MTAAVFSIRNLPERVHTLPRPFGGESCQLALNQVFRRVRKEDVAMKLRDDAKL